MRNQPGTIEDKWKTLKEAFSNIVDNNLRQNKNNSIKLWMSRKIIALINIRRKYKNLKTNVS